MPDYHVTWERYHQLIETLAQQIYRSGWEFDQILAIARGGLRIGDTLSRMFHKPLAIISAQSYVGQQRGDVRLANSITTTQPQLGPRLLVVDDMVDSGQTLAKIVNHLLGDPNADIQALKTAVLWVKAHTQFQPDYYVEFLVDNPWIHQPFERYEHWQFDG
ncbi:MAG: phosphoribosyltransferase family protein [Gloeomargarita sp. SKYG116]|nr:phosphoribosyltransferase family protein [Gloeomargarita sp. SKYG116]MDW8402367.1 phosphoribosyltransferase family protein [Gloeomargarita sp. SKYGB_i_bin116]